MKKSLVILLIMFFILAILTSLYFDSEIVKGISLIKNNLLNEFFLGITFSSYEIIIFLFLASFLFLLNEKKARWILPLWITLALSSVISFLLKISIQRQRPYQLGLVSILPALEKASHLTWNFSFPSSHAMLVFCAIPILWKGFPKFKYVWIIFACLVAFSRVYLGLHFLTDVIAGGLIGYLLGLMGIKLEKSYKFGDKVYKKIFRK